MTSFIVLVAVMTAVAIAFIAVPLWRANRSLIESSLPSGEPPRAQINLEVLRQQRRELELEKDRGVLSIEQYQVDVEELEQRVLTESGSDTVDNSESKRRGAGGAVMAILGLAIPLLSGVLYWHLGTPKAIETTSAIKDATPTAAQIAAGVAAAQRRVKADPKDTQAWLMLARGQIVTGNDDEAVHAYEEVIKLVPSEPEPFLELAELLARKSGTLAGRPTQLIEQALTASPRYWKALALSGRAAFDRGDYAMALQRWEALKEIVPKDSAALPAIEQGISEVHARLAKSETQSSSKENATVSSVSGTVSLDDGLRARAQAEDTVFIFARMAAGSPMPLAVLRKQVRDLPLNFTLDDSMSMSPQMRISGAKEIVVEARISKSGDAMPKSGDLQGKSAIVAPGDSSLQVRIDTVVP